MALPVKNCSVHRATAVPVLWEYSGGITGNSLFGCSGSNNQCCYLLMSHARGDIRQSQTEIRLIRDTLTGMQTAVDSSGCGK